MTAYYNDNDKFAAAALRNLIALGAIAPGVVDDRSIKDVQPDDLKGFTQVHLFAGCGGWSYAARLAGWPDNRPLWSASCPCQPFSDAGLGRGFDDPRHLWPDVLRLTRAARPSVVMGEQTAGSAGYGWFDRVRADLAGEDYASRCVDIPSLAVDAPHIRNRLYWVAVGQPGGGGLQGPWLPDQGREGLPLPPRPDGWVEGGAPRELAHSEGDDGGSGLCEDGALIDGPVAANRDGGDRSTGALAHRSGGGAGSQGVPLAPWIEGAAGHGPDAQRTDRRDGGHDRRNAPASFWSGADWIICHDAKARRAQPGVPLLVDGLRGRVAVGDALGAAGAALSPEDAAHVISRVGAWKLFGNAINPWLAAEVIAAFADEFPWAAA